MFPTLTLSSLCVVFIDKDWVRARRLWSEGYKEVALLQPESYSSQELHQTRQAKPEHCRSYWATYANRWGSLLVMDRPTVQAKVPWRPWKWPRGQRWTNDCVFSRVLGVKSTETAFVTPRGRWDVLQLQELNCLTTESKKSQARLVSETTFRSRILFQFPLE